MPPSASRSWPTRHRLHRGAGPSRSRTASATSAAACASSSRTPRCAWRRRSLRGCGMTPGSRRRLRPSAPSWTRQGSQWSSTSTCTGPRLAPAAPRMTTRSTTATARRLRGPAPPASSRALASCGRPSATPACVQQHCRHWTWMALPRSSFPVHAALSCCLQALASPQPAASQTTGAAAACGRQSRPSGSQRRRSSGRASPRIPSGSPASSSTVRTRYRGAS
mmetsp:Transcript_92865/g.239836  ORF Transcript_92865/g.239836 Transcript_92865/m.239836 type:complete len:222 (+) Transcript_92865:58-723(+)